MYHINNFDILSLASLSAFALLGLYWMIRAYTKNSDWLSLALTNIGDAIITTDKHGHVMRLNQIAQNLTGWSQVGAAHKPISEIMRLLNHDTRMEIDNPVIKALATGQVSKLQKDTLLIARNNSEIPIECVASPLEGRSGKKRAVLIFRDISERHCAEQMLAESEDRMRAVTNQAHIGLVMINRDRCYVYVNNRYMQMIGYSTLNVLGKRVADVLPVVYEQIKPNLDRAFAGERVSYELKGVQNKELGLNRTYSVTYEPQIRQSLVMNVVIVVIDITDIKKGG